MIVLERALEMLKYLRHDTATQREIEAHTGLSSSAVTTYLRLLEQHGFIDCSLSAEKQTKGRVPRVFSLSSAWRGRIAT